jgi:putative YhdH/YhfP family quinone oxidoreductase
MILGTAGFTAALSVEALLAHGVTPGSGEIVVTGATGGVGCIAVRLLARMGFTAVAVTGKTASHGTLREWGAREVVGREAVVDTSGKPLLSARWAGGIDTVGGAMLATTIRQTRPGGCITACGLVGGTDLPLTVYPFILRGVTLAGIDSAWCSHERRVAVWNRLATDWRLDGLEGLATESPRADVGQHVTRILAGDVLGRTVVRIPQT